MRSLLVFTLLLSSVLANAQDDEMYFTSRKKSKTTTSTYAAPNSSVRTQTQSDAYNYGDNSTVDYGMSRRSDDEYNRRYSNGISQSQQSASDDYDEDVTDVDNNEVDYRYSRRLLRFHGPSVVVVSSPYYWDLVYGCGV